MTLKQQANVKKLDPPGVLKLTTILKNHLFQKEDGNDGIEFALKLKRARLDRLNLLDIEEGIKFLGAATHIYMQHVMFCLIRVTASYADFDFLLIL
jgi:hypothetical protein